MGRKGKEEKGTEGQKRSQERIKREAHKKVSRPQRTA